MSDFLFCFCFCLDEPGFFKFGLVDRDVADYQSLSGLYLLPLRKMGRRIARQVRRLRGAPARPGA